MTRAYVFADESGNFDFSRNQRASKYFIVCTVVLKSCEIGHALMELRRELVWSKATLGPQFHASEDKQAVRDRVFGVIQTHDFEIQATIMEKAKSQPQVRESDARFYKYGWLYHLRYGTRKSLRASTEILITAASVATGKKQATFTEAVNDVAQQILRRENWATNFCPAANDPCLQVADYCTWALQRKWEGGDSRPYDVLKDRINHEYEMWRHGTVEYY